MGGLSRYLSILRLFEKGRTEWTVPEIAVALNAPGSTIYRTIRELVAQGFLEASFDSRYRLGTFFVEFDRLVRVTDPLYSVGTVLLRSVVVQSHIPCVAVLARLYGDTVMCVADFEETAGKVRTSYERGRPMPLTHGATSKAILAQLPVRRLTKLLVREKNAGNRPCPQSQADFREELNTIRKRGYSVTRGEVDKGLVGIAAPVNVPDRALLASLSLVISANELDAITERRLILLVISSASMLAEELRIQNLPSESARRGMVVL
jgi:DNA-binding IclR family transcriptional regulator